MSRSRVRRLVIAIPSGLVGIVVIVAAFNIEAIDRWIIDNLAAMPLIALLAIVVAAILTVVVSLFEDDVDP